ncbi:uncharacterized protein PgNI_00957 [Pyricularia grisea]|uniref:Uncharacterized protein n=1 Tax=Pyricularia grisea TaxID=148305 RepID=A0A6P8BLR7_PYRGI|nr:uncharacterized protein PgNI_00957 [Pyricularia grisea]TLD17639.1 hypothetical protein PgNI_00957 [Pyricularia grisea]
MASHSWLQPTTNSEQSIKPPITKQHDSTPKSMPPSLINDNVDVTEAALSQPNATEPKQRVKMKRTSGIQASRIGHAFKTSAAMRSLSHGMHRPLLGKQAHSISLSNVRQTHISPPHRPATRIASYLTDEDEDDDENGSRSTSASSSNLGKRDRYCADYQESDISPPSSKRIKGVSPLVKSLLNATHDRPYTIYRDPSGGDKQARGALIPEGYTASLEAGKYIWPCPVRSCGVKTETLTALGEHFSTSHHSTTFNDNRDGSLSKLGTYGRLGEMLPGIVVAQVPRKTSKKDWMQTNNGEALKSNRQRSIDSPGYGASTPSKEDGRQQHNSSSFKPRNHDKLDVQFEEREQNLQDDFQLRNYYPSQRKYATASTSHGSTPAQIRNKAAVTRQRSPVDIVAKSTRRLTETPIPIPTPGRKNAHRAESHDSMEIASTIMDGEADSSNLSSANAESAWEFCLKYTKIHKSIPTNLYVPEFLQMPFVREMQWNEPWLEYHPWTDSSPRDITSLLMHRTGEVSSKPCERCSKKLGPYSGCITIPLGLSPATQSMIYSCSNCLYHGGNARCSIKEQLKSEFQQRYPDFNRKQENAQMQTQLEEDNRDISPELADPDPLSSASPQAAATRTRGPPVNYNIKKLSKNSMGVDRSKPSRARSREAPDPLNQDDEEHEAASKLRTPRNSDFGMTGTNGRKVSNVPLPSRSHPKVTGVPNGVRSTHSAMTTASAIDTPAKVPRVVDEKMETWEVGPGFVRNEESDKIAFSTAYLNGPNPVHIADGVSCRIEFLKAGCSKTFDAENTLRICWVSSGKVEVELDGKKFSVGGPGGIIKISKGSKAVVFNTRYIDACLQITAIAVED